MYQALFEELKEIIKSKDEDKIKLLKIETLVGLADKIKAPMPVQSPQPIPQQPAQQPQQPEPTQPAVVRSEGAIVDMTPPLKHKKK